MYALRRTLDYAGVLSDELRDLLVRRLREVGGSVLIGMAALAGLALATWSVQDPSLSHATSARVRNILGLPGAITADLLMQLIGLGALAVILPIAAWGWRLISHRPFDHERLRLFLWVVGVPLAAAFASCFPTGAQWPLPTGLGGVVGDAILRIPAFLLGGPLAGASRTAATIVTGTAAFAMLVYACGVGSRERASVVML
jgi:S-DNA-T family DNA segregation ATPase FtsK/SpoIIIE